MLEETRLPVSVCTYMYMYMPHGVLITALRAYKRLLLQLLLASRYSDLACYFVPRALALALLAVVAPVDTAHKPQ